MNHVTLVCTRSAINASALTYLINQEPDYYNYCHNNLWLNEISDKFGTAHTINDWWNVPDGVKYNKNIRNATQLTYDDLMPLCDSVQAANLGKNIAFFTHAPNFLEISSIVEHHKLPVNIITTCIGDNSHHFVTSWLRREYNKIMNTWEDQQQAWTHLYKQRIIQDSLWRSSNTKEMYEWLYDPSNHWLNEYNKANGILFDFNADEYWDKLGTITKLSVFLWLLNKFIAKHNNNDLALRYAELLLEEQQKYRTAPWQDIEEKTQKRLGLY